MNQDVDIDKIIEDTGKIVVGLSQAMSELLLSKTHLFETKQELRREQDEVLLKYSADPKALGMNEQVREARMRELCLLSQIQYDEAEVAVMQATNTVEIMKLSWDYMRFTLRAYQLVNTTIEE